MVHGLTTFRRVSAAGNRRAFRVAQEPFDMFRSCFAFYAREQAYHFSPALISNLERYWNAQSRRPDAAGAASRLGAAVKMLYAGRKARRRSRRRERAMITTTLRLAVSLRLRWHARPRTGRTR